MNSNLREAFRNTEAGENGILYPRESLPDPDNRAETTWSTAAQEGGLSWAAASDSSNYFVKYPDWIDPYIADSPHSLLDAGCGYGRLAIPLLEKYPNLHVVGLDATQVMLDKFMELAYERGVSDRVLLYKGNLPEIPVEDHTFDYVLTSAVLLHLPRHETKKVVSELYRVLKPGGHALFNGSFVNPLNPEGIQDWLYELVRLGRTSSKNGPVRTYTRAQITELFKQEPWHSLEMFPTRLTLIPRALVVNRAPVPFGKQVRSINRSFTKTFEKILSPSGLFVTSYEVAARK